MHNNELAWDANGNATSAASRQWSAGFTEKGHGFALTDTRYALRLENDEPVLTVIKERRPATEQESMWLYENDYGSARRDVAPASHPLSPWHSGAKFSTETLPCHMDAVPKERFGDLTWAELALIYLVQAIESETGKTEAAGSPSE